MRTRLIQLHDPFGRWRPAIAVLFDTVERDMVRRAESMFRLVSHFASLSR